MSTTAAPGLTMSGFTIPGRPTAATSTSARRVCSARSAVREWQIVTVAFSARSSIAIGLPASSLRPITTASLPSSSMPCSASMTMTPEGRRGHVQRLAEEQAAGVERMQAVDVLLRVDRADDPSPRPCAPEAGAGRGSRRRHRRRSAPRGARAPPTRAWSPAAGGRGSRCPPSSPPRASSRRRCATRGRRRRGSSRGRPAAERLDVFRDLRANLLGQHLAVDADRRHRRRSLVIACGCTRRQRGGALSAPRRPTRGPYNPRTPADRSLSPAIEEIWVFAPPWRPAPWRRPTRPGLLAAALDTCAFAAGSRPEPSRPGSTPAPARPDSRPGHAPRVRSLGARDLWSRSDGSRSRDTRGDDRDRQRAPQAVRLDLAVVEEAA